MCLFERFFSLYPGKCSMSRRLLFFLRVFFYLLLGTIQFLFQNYSHSQHIVYSHFYIQFAHLKPMSKLFEINDLIFFCTLCHHLFQQIIESVAYNAKLYALLSFLLLFSSTFKSKLWHLTAFIIIFSHL